MPEAVEEKIIEYDESDDEVAAKAAAPDDEDRPSLDFATEDADSDKEAPAAKPKAKRSQWLKEAAELKREAEDSRREAAELRERLERLERGPERPAETPKAAKRDALSGDKLIDLLAEKGETGLAEIVESMVSERLANERREMETAFEQRLRVRDDVATLVQQFPFMGDSNSEGYKAALARQKQAAQRDGGLQTNLEVWRMAAEIASLRQEVSEVKKRRKGGSSGFVGAGDDDSDYVSLPPELEGFIRNANMTLGADKLRGSDIAKAIKAGRVN